MGNNRWVWTKPFKLSNSTLLGSFIVDIPQAAEFMAVMNGSGAQIAMSLGTTYSQPQDAITIQPFVYMGFPISRTQKMTAHWNAPNGTLAVGSDSGVLIFSNEPIIVSGGPVTTGGVASNVNVQNTATVNINTMPELTIVAAPTVKGSDYAGSPANHVLKVGAGGELYLASLPAGVAHIGKVEVDTALPAGTAHIGKVEVDTALPAGTNLLGKMGIDQTSPGTTNGVQVVAALPAGANLLGHVVTDGDVKAATVGIISSSRVSVLTAATILFNSVVNGKAITIQNFDGAGYLYLGPATVTNTNGGVRIGPGGSYTLDVVSGSTIVIYGAGSVALTAGIGVVN